MENLLICLNAVLPIFITMAVGYVACLAGIIRRENVAMINKVSFKVFMPALSFHNIYRSDLSSTLNGGLVIFALAVTLLSFFISWFFTARSKTAAERKGVIVQALFRTNYVIIALPFAQHLLGADADIAVIAVLAAVIVPLFNVLAVLILAFYGGEKPDPKAILRGIITNPIIIGTAAGLVVSLGKLPVPEAVETVVGEFSAVASPLMLFLLGAFFRFDGLRRNAGALVLVSALRLVLIPGVVMGAGLLLGYRGVEFVAILCLSATPVAVSSFTMAQQMNGDGELAGSIVVVTSFLCSLTLFLWSLLFKSLGIF